jgi:hypothetical protein
MTMKNLKNLVPVFAIVLGLGLVVTQSAFKPTTDTVWVFDGDQLSEAQDASQYHVDMEAPSCEIGSSLPCKVISDGSSSTSVQDFQDYLDITFETPGQVLAAASGKRD